MNPLPARQVLTVGLFLVAIVSGATGAGRDLAVAGGADDPAPPEYCKQDSDWYLCQHNQEPSVPPTTAPSQDPVGSRGPERATTVGSLPR
jgi:hypothetical protein